MSKSLRELVACVVNAEVVVCLKADPQSPFQQRNAAIVLGNQRAVSAIPALTKGAADEEPLIREACAWALEQMKS